MRRGFWNLNFILTNSSIENCSFQYKNSTQNKVNENAFTPPFKIPSTWTWVRLGDIQIEINFENIKIPTKDYLKSGLYPIVSQDKEPISGFTNLETPILDLPIIVFGDHTCNIKYIDFPFFQGADGVKLIKPLKAINVKYLYFWLKSLNILKDKYTRHYKFIKNLELPLPPLKEQQEIAKNLEALFTLCKGLKVE